MVRGFGLDRIQVYARIVHQLTSEVQSQSKRVWQFIGGFLTINKVRKKNPVLGK
jgi:hypothetical protein